VIPTWRRQESLRRALKTIFACEPAPAETLVHVDVGDTGTGAVLGREFAGAVTWLQSAEAQGPGGGRNLLIREARYPFVASFDDDSWPIDKDYFDIARRLMEANPKAGVLTGKVILPGQKLEQRRQGSSRLCGSFEAGACVIRRTAFLQTSGFVPLRRAYGMEEADIALQLLDAKWTILRTAALRVFHDSCLGHHASRDINAAHITNTALLAFLRYPVYFWPFGACQTMNRVFYALRAKRYRGIIKGLKDIPRTVAAHRASRKPVKGETICHSRRLAQTAGLGPVSAPLLPSATDRKSG